MNNLGHIAVEEVALEGDYGEFQTSYIAIQTSHSE